MLKQINFLKQLLLLLLLAGVFVYCPAQINAYQKSFGADTGHTQFYDGLQTADGGYIMVGSTDIAGAGSNDVYLVKTDGDGNLQWTKTYGGPGVDEGYAVKPTTDGGYIITGGVNMQGYTGDVLLLKTNSTGDTLWTKKYGGPYADIGSSVVQTSDGGYVICGSTMGSNPVDYLAVYMIKTDANGDTTWKRKIEDGSNYHSSALSVIQNTDGDLIVAGEAIHPYPDHSTNLYLLKMTTSGNLLWSKLYGDTTNYNIAHQVLQTTDGGYIMVGSLGGSAFTGGIVVVKTDAAGDTTWTKTYHSTGNDYCSSIEATSDGGYVISGYYAYTNLSGNFAPEGYLFKISGTGDVAWSKRYHPTEMQSLFYAMQTTDGGYAALGYVANSDFYGLEGYLVKTDASGNSYCGDSTVTTVITHEPKSVSVPPTTMSSFGYYIQAPISVGSGGTVSSSCSPTGIEQIAKEGTFSISPNPSMGDFKIEMNEAVANATIEIFNSLGEKIFEEPFSDISTMEIHLRDIPAGIYIAEVSDGEKEFVQKLVIGR